MKTLEELKAFCEDWHKHAVAEHSGDVSGLDEWFRWGGYDLNIFGAHYSVELSDAGDNSALIVCAYPGDWSTQLPEPIHQFTLKGATT